MFAGRRRRSSNNIRIMQLFHELKQQFPTVPDHIVTSCISTYGQFPITSTTNSTIREILEAAAVAAAATSQEQMGRSPPQPHSPTLAVLTPQPLPPTPPSSSSLAANLSTTSSLSHNVTERNRVEMHNSVSDINQNVVAVKKLLSAGGNETRKRPDNLAIRPEAFGFPCPSDDSPTRLNNIQLSGKCKNVHKLLNSHNVCEKPPKSPLSAKRFAAKNSPVKSTPTIDSNCERRLPTPDEPVKKTVSTPTQTTDTLLGGVPTTPNSVNLSLNVKCSMDLVQSPNKHKAVLQVTPQQPWLQDPVSPRSYNSVNFIIRPPSSQPQAPIDITSQNSSLTYSTSSFDSKKGLQSRLQITVGPGGSSVAASRARPRSCYNLPNGQDEVVPVRSTGSLNDLTGAMEPPVIIRQQARIEKLRIELTTEKTKLVALRQDVSKLEEDHKEKDYKLREKLDADLKKELLLKMRHLKYQLFQKQRNGDYYQFLVEGTDFTDNFTSPLHNLNEDHQKPPSPPPNEDRKWTCTTCTFNNHPALNNCEQCEMPRIHLGTQLETLLT